MSGFKEMVAADTSSAFLNLDEFAETVNINGRLVPAVLEDGLTNNPNVGTIGRQIDMFTDGLFRSGITVFLSESDMERIPTAREIMRINGKPYAVLSVKQDVGLLEIALEVNDA